MESNFRRDWIELLSIFNAHGVDYMLVGAHALTYLLQPRATNDLDLFVAPTPDNFTRVLDALREFGAPTWGVTIEEFTAGIVLQIGVAPGRVDIISKIDGVTWEEARRGRQHVPFHDVQTWVIGEEAFIRNKLSTGRAKDREDVEMLQRARDQSRGR